MKSLYVKDGLFLLPAATEASPWPLHWNSLECIAVHGEVSITACACLMLSLRFCSSNVPNGRISERNIKRGTCVTSAGKRGTDGSHVFRSFRKFAESSAEGLKSEIAAAIAGSPPEHSSEISEFSLRFDCAEDEEE